ncbi:hypothetical protein GCM10022409_47120 [Hymenobacter glaciei]|uniref:Uncharacterized protein n=1 Tax=Hymenobacter glaciei TaxID=877209 RepID=A0ABP7UWQ6_9BACT
MHKNAVATVGTDGLVDNTIINLTAGPGPAAPPVNPGDARQTRTAVGIDAMLSTLDVSNKNLVGITRDLREITGKLNGSKALWDLLNDQTLASSVHQSMETLQHNFLLRGYFWRQEKKKAQALGKQGDAHIPNPAAR